MKINILWLRAKMCAIRVPFGMVCLLLKRNLYKRRTYNVCILGNVLSDCCFLVGMIYNRKTSGKDLTIINFN